MVQEFARSSRGLMSSW